MSAMTEHMHERRWVTVCRAIDVPNEDALQLGTVPSTALFRSENELFCIDDICTHEVFPLSEGWVEDCRVECALHGAKFDLRSGAAIGAPAVTAVATHPVRVEENGTVSVLLPSDYSTGGML